MSAAWSTGYLPTAPAAAVPRPAATPATRPATTSATPAPVPACCSWPFRSEGTRSVRAAMAMPRSRVSSASAGPPGTSSTISAAPRRSTTSWTTCWKTVIGKRCAHQRVQPCVCGSTQQQHHQRREHDQHVQEREAHQHLEDQQERHHGVRDRDDDERDPLLRDVRLLVAGQADLADGGGEGVVDLDEDARELEREVHGEGGEDDAGGAAPSPPW